MIITKTGFFTKLSLLALTSLSLAYSNTNCSNSSKIAILGLTAVGTYLGVMRIKSSINARLSLNDPKASYRDVADDARLSLNDPKESYRDGAELRQEWKLERQSKQKQQHEVARDNRRQELKSLIDSGMAGFFDIVRYRLALY